MASPAPTGEKGLVQQHYDEFDQSTQTPRSPPGSSPSTSNQQNASLSQTPPPHHQSTTPPPYSGPSSALPGEEDREDELQQQQQQQQQQQREGGASLRTLPRYPGLPRLDYSLYSPATFELQEDAKGIKSKAKYLSANTQALLNLVRSQATVPPKPVIEIKGHHSGRVDFDVRCNLMSLLVPDDPRDKLDYIRCVGAGELALRGGSKPKTSPHPGEGGLEDWVRAYLRDPSATKCFVLERQVVYLDANWLEGQVRTMVAAMDYKGIVTVEFPLLHSRVTVQSPDKVNRFFTSVSALFTGWNNYEVVKAVWPFATHRKGEAGRRCAVQSEETWWREWRDPIKYAIATRRFGWVTNEDKLEAIMEGKGKGVTAVDWGTTSGPSKA